MSMKITKSVIILAALKSTRESQVGFLSGKSPISALRILVRRRTQVEVQRALVGIRASAHEV